MIRVFCVPARVATDHRSEMVTQWLCGERIRVLERRRSWVRAVGADDYAAWAPEGAVLEADAADFWRADAWSLGVTVLGSDGARGYLPWGARLQKK
ncbi:MAG: hypothetical protein P8Y07_15200 [Gemmatimonadales bacterium]